MLHTAFIPAAEKNSRRLLVLLHGLGDSLEGWRWLPDALKLPSLNYLRLSARHRARHSSQPPTAVRIAR
jgi:predicted esterase